MNRIIQYLWPIAICMFVGVLASKLQRDGIDNWYPFLHRPHVIPSRRTFGLVWTALYILIGLSMGRIISRPDCRIARREWWAQVALCFLWSVCFFVLHEMLWAMGVLLLLGVTVLDYVIITFRRDIVAALCFIPYLAWVAFCCYLNGVIYIYN